MEVTRMNPVARLGLPPGFRFYPTDEELLVQYLCRKVAGHHFSLPIIGEIDLYKFNPWELPERAVFGEKEWYFFSPRDRKYPNGSRPNRVAGKGYWKATGTDRVIMTQGRKVGIKKALVFYVGKAPKGDKTNWIMHEYRLSQVSSSSSATKLDDWVLCRIYRKNSASGKPVAGEKGSKEQSTGGLSSSSHLEDVTEHGLEAYQTVSSLTEVNQQNFVKSGLDWNMLAAAGLTGGPEMGPIGLYQEEQPTGHVICDESELREVDSEPEKLSRRVEEEAQRVNSPGYDGLFYGLLE